MTTEPTYTDAQIETAAARLEVLSRAVADGLKSEFTMRVPAEPERDADLVLSRSSAMLRSLLSERQAAMQGQGGEVHAAVKDCAADLRKHAKQCHDLPKLADDLRRMANKLERKFAAALQPPQPVRSVSDDRLKLIREAVAANGGVWPEELTSGVLFWRGERITRNEFAAIAQEKQS